MAQLRKYQGRDLSSYDTGPINYHAYSFGFIKATQGASFVSPGWQAKTAAARAAGMVIGWYHWLDGGISGAVQADHFLNVTGNPGPDDFPGVLDFEAPGISVGDALNFMNRYKQRTGVYPIVYSGVSMYRDVLKGHLPAGTIRWLARYGADTAGEPCEIWQWQGGPDLDTTDIDPRSMTLAGKSHPTATTEDDSMGACALNDGTVALFAVGTDGFPYLSLDDGAKWVPVSKGRQFLPGAGLATLDGVGLLATVRDSAKGIHLLHVPDPTKPTIGYVDQPLGGTGSGSVSIVVTASKAIHLAVRGTDGKGTIYVDTIQHDGTHAGWKPTKGRAL